MVRSGSRADGADRTPSTARSTATRWLRANDPESFVPRNALICGRSCADTTLSAVVSVSPSASQSAISLGSVPVRSLPSCLADAEAVSERAEQAWRQQQELLG
jgi:hypothetical protein